MRGLVRKGLSEEETFKLTVKAQEGIVHVNAGERGKGH